MDDSLRFDKGVTRGPNPSAFIEGTRVPFGRSPTIDRMKKGGKTKGYTGKIIKPPKDYKAKIRNLADPNVSSEESYDAMMKRLDKEDMQKK